MLSCVVLPSLTAVDVCCTVPLRATSTFSRMQSMMESTVASNRFQPVLQPFGVSAYGHAGPCVRRIIHVSILAQKLPSIPGGKSKIKG